MENRRSFLTKATLGLAAAGASSVPAASDQFVVGFIGTGIRANAALIPQFEFNPAFRIAALCDVYKPNLEQAATLVGGNVVTYGDYRRVLDRKDIDVVVIATPDHWHCPMTIEACQAGREVQQRWILNLRWLRNDHVPKTDVESEFARSRTAREISPGRLHSPHSP